MKGLNVLKRFLIACSLGLGVGYADVLPNYLSSDKNKLFQYEFQLNNAKSNVLENGWINPVILQYSKNFSEQYTDKKVISSSFSVGIDQPIFRSGGIYFAIKYAQAVRGANDVQITLQKQQMIGQAVKLLFDIEKLGLEKEKLALLILNNKLDIRQKREHYQSGILASSFLDQALLQANLNETKMLEMNIALQTLYEQFSLLSDADPKALKLPHLKLISQKLYQSKNLEVVREKLRAKEKHYSAQMTWAKYMPSVSLQGRYVDNDVAASLRIPGQEERYMRYGFTISMPLNVNMFSDIEASKVARLKAETEVIERKRAVEEEYRMVIRRLKMVEQKIKLAKQDAKLYGRLYRQTRDLEKIGEKTYLDTRMMYQSLKIRKLDQKIYKIEKQIELIGLYVKVENAI